MRRMVLVLLAAVALSGCISTLEGAYDEQARADCDANTQGTERSECYDRVDQNRRDRR